MVRLENFILYLEASYLALPNPILKQVLNKLANFQKDKVAILLATHNGFKWVTEQIHSILCQKDVELCIYISDDLSQDGTYEYLLNLAHENHSINVLPRSTGFGSAGKNFYRLIQEVDITGFEYVAYADQDDIWELDKLSRHIQLMKQHRVDGVSSNVTAFWPDGRKKLIIKSQPQREFDFLFESAGPGCSFLMSTRLVIRVKELLLAPHSQASHVTLHDWLTYAVCRASGYKWLIDDKSSLQYRQHQNNVLGANAGIQTKLIRLKKLRDGWYKSQVIRITQLSYSISADIRFKDLLDCLENKSPNKLDLIRYIWHGRRSFVDRLYLNVAILLNYF